MCVCFEGLGCHDWACWRRLGSVVGVQFVYWSKDKEKEYLQLVCQAWQNLCVHGWQSRDLSCPSTFLPALVPSYLRTCVPACHPWLWTPYTRILAAHLISTSTFDKIWRHWWLAIALTTQPQMRIGERRLSTPPPEFLLLLHCASIPSLIDTSE